MVDLRSLITQFARNAKACFLDERSELTQTRNRHANGGCRQTEAGVNGSGVIPDGSSYAANVRFMLFEIEGVTGFSYTKKMLLKFRNRSDGVLRQALWFDLREDFLELFLRHVGKKNFSNGRAIERNGSADTRKNSQVFGRVQFFDIDGGIALANSEVNRFASMLIERLQVGETEAANIQLSERGVADGEAGDPQMIFSVAAAIEESSFFEVYQEAMDGTDGETGKFCDLACGKPVRRLRKQTGQAQTTLDRSDFVGSFLYG